MGLLHFPVTQLPQLLASQAVNGLCDQEQYTQLWAADVHPACPRSPYWETS